MNKGGELIASPRRAAGGLIGIYRVLCDSKMKGLLLLPNRMITVVRWDE